jgi:hypothetical protein
MEHKIVVHGTKKGSTWNQKGLSYGDSRRTLLEPFLLRVYRAQVLVGDSYVDESEYTAIFK